MIHALLILSYVVASLAIAWAGRDRRFGFWGYFFATLLFTPILGLLLLLATDSPARMPPSAARHD